MDYNARVNALPERFRLLRDRSGMSQEALSAHLHLSASVWGHLESGRMTPSLETLLKICQVFQTTPNWLLSYKE
jgi:transcriptional regulator with XRE-family HTH domain